MFNRVAFVTGASRGIGRAIALTLCRAGFDIVVASPEIEKNEEVAEEIRACSGEAMTVNLDVTSPDSIKEAFAKALKDKSRIDVLVNNAGITRDGLAVRMKPADWDLVLQHQSGRRVPLHPAGAARHDAQPLGPHHQYRVRGGAGGQRGPGQLRGFEGRPDRPDQGAGAGNGAAATSP